MRASSVSITKTHAMLDTPSLLRKAELETLSRIELRGKVLDLGGVKGSSYLSSFKGEFSVTTLNLDKSVNPDIVHDLEHPLPVGDETYDHILLINVLEHIFEYDALLSEAKRVVKKGGSVIVAVPFLFPNHPSPKDYHRFTEESLRHKFVNIGLKDVQIISMGGGVFSAMYLLIDRLLPKFLRFCNYYTMRYVVCAMDFVFLCIARTLGKKYSPKDYAFGFCGIATKH